MDWGLNRTVCYHQWRIIRGADVGDDQPGLLNSYQKQSKKSDNKSTQIINDGFCFYIHTPNSSCSLMKYDNSALGNACTKTTI